MPGVPNSAVSEPGTAKLSRFPYRFHLPSDRCGPPNIGRDGGAILLNIAIHYIDKTCILRYLAEYENLTAHAVEPAAAKLSYSRPVQSLQQQRKNSERFAVLWSAE